MEIYVRDKVVENAAEMGGYAMDRLNAEFKPLRHVGDIGGLGLMIGIEIVADKKTKKNFKPDVILKAQKQAFDAGLFIRAQTTNATPGNRFFFAPPLIIKKQEVDKILDILFPILSNI